MANNNNSASKKKRYVFVVTSLRLVHRQLLPSSSIAHFSTMEAAGRGCEDAEQFLDDRSIDIAHTETIAGTPQGFGRRRWA